MRLFFSFILLGLTVVACGNDERKANKATHFVAQADSVAQPQFTTLHFSVDDKPCVATIDQRYKNFGHKSEFPLSLFVTITTSEKDKNGHPTVAEARIFSELEQEILSALNSTSLNAYVGKTTMNGYRDLIFYIKPADQQKVTDALGALQKKHSRINEFTFEEDPQWEAVAEFYQAIGKSN